MPKVQLMRVRNVLFRAQFFYYMPIQVSMELYLLNIHQSLAISTKADQS